MRRDVILCVDDEQNILNSLRRIFLDEPYEILVATSGKEALEILGERPVDLIISDERMPGMTGVEFLSLAKNVRPEAVRIVLSGYTDPRALVKAINEGEISKFIAKPWNNNELKAAVKQSLESRELAREQGVAARVIQGRGEDTGAPLDEDRAHQDQLQQRMPPAACSQCELLEALPMGVVSIGSDERIQFINTEARRLLDSDREQEDRSEDIFPADLRHLVSEVLHHHSPRSLRRYPSGRRLVNIQCLPVSEGIGAYGAMLVLEELPDYVG